MTMRKIFTPVALIGLLVLTGCPDPEAPVPRVDEAAERDSIRQTIERAGVNVTAQNWDAFREDLTGDFVQYGDGQSMTFEEMRDFFDRHMTEHESSFHDIEIRVSPDGQMAWATFSEETTYLFDGQPGEDRALFTAIFEKHDDRWRVAHVHRSVARPMPEQ